MPEQAPNPLAFSVTNFIRGRFTHLFHIPCNAENQQLPSTSNLTATDLGVKHRSNPTKLHCTESFFSFAVKSWRVFFYESTHWTNLQARVPNSNAFNSHVQYWVILPWQWSRASRGSLKQTVQRRKFSMWNYHEVPLGIYFVPRARQA